MRFSHGNAKQQICTMLGKRNQFGWQLPCRDLLLHDLTLSRLKVIFYLFRFIGSAVLRRCQIRCLCNVHQSLIYLIRPNSTKVVYVLQASREMSEAVLLFLLVLWVLDKTKSIVLPETNCAVDIVECTAGAVWRVVWCVVWSVNFKILTPVNGADFILVPEILLTSSITLYNRVLLIHSAHPVLSGVSGRVCSWHFRVV